MAVLIASAVALLTIDKIFAPDLLYESEDRKHSHKYSEIGWMLLGIGIAGVIIQVAMAIIRKLYMDNFIKEYFVIFASIVSCICDPK